MAEGFLHEFQGWAVFMVSTALLFGEIVLLNGSAMKTAIGGSSSASNCRRDPRGSAIRSRSVPLSFITATICWCLRVATAETSRPAEAFPQRAAFVIFPCSWTLAWCPESLEPCI